MHLIVAFSFCAFLTQINATWFTSIKGCIIEKEYDYIIVGAGTAGSILANVLSKNENNKVLLIEEGGWSSQWDLISDASSWWSLLFEPQVERGYTTTPQEFLKNRTLWYPRAKVTGGCNSINAMVWILGNKKDFDERWNISGWKWNDLEPYWDYIESTFKTTRGDVDINSFWMNKFLTAGQQVGYRYNPDPNDLTNNGQGGCSMRRYMGKMDEFDRTRAIRESSWTAYTEPILNRSNLDVMVYTRVNRILFDKPKQYFHGFGYKSQNPKANGVEVVSIGTRKRDKIFAKKKVILSAGAIDTPKILMLSGIGDCDYLATFGIKCISDVPAVGKSLQDHTFTQVISPPLKEQNASKLDLPISPWGFYGSLNIHEDGNFYNSLSITQRFGQYVISSFAESFHYESRGRVLLYDNDPNSNPIIDASYLSTKFDENRFIEAINKSRELLYSDELIDLYGDVQEEMLPGYDVQSDEEILEFGRQSTSTDFHPAGTCKMGEDFSDGDIVVDKKLSVKGVEHLKIVDGSVMPELISGNPNQITMIIAFKAGDIILQEDRHSW